MKVEFLHPGIYKGNGPLGSAIVCHQSGTTLTIRSRYMEGTRKASTCKAGVYGVVEKVEVCIDRYEYQPEPWLPPEWCLFASFKVWPRAGKETELYWCRFVFWCRDHHFEHSETTAGYHQVFDYTAEPDGDPATAGITANDTDGSYQKNAGVDYNGSESLPKCATDP